MVETGNRELKNIPPYKRQNENEDLDASFTRAKRTEADVLFVGELSKPDLAKPVFEHAGELVMVGEFPAKDLYHGPAQLVKLVGDANLVAEHLKLLISPRMIRLLCKKCKQAFRPNPKLVRKMGLPPETKVLYRPQRPVDDPEFEYEPCRFCNGIGYRGKIGLYATVIVNDEIREAIRANRSPNTIKELSRKAEQPAHHTEGLRLVAEGLTSLEELQRIFK